MRILSRPAAVNSVNDGCNTFATVFFVKKDGKAQHIGSEPEDLPRAIVIITLSRNRAYGFVGAFIVV